MSATMNDVSPDASVSNDMLVNNLVYRQPSALSLATARAYMRHFPQVQTYSAGQTMVFDLTSGSNFVDPANSYLTFKVQLVTADALVAANFGSGSAMNLIRQVTIRSRSGTELDRVELANFWSRNYYLNTLSNEYLQRSGPVEGWGSNRDGASDSATVSSAIASRFCLPLSRLSHLFKPQQKGQKLPPALMSGLHIEIIWEDPRTALYLKTGLAGDVAGYTVSNIAIVTDSISMTDDVQRTINMESAQSGLEICYDRVFTTQTALNTGATSANISVRKAVSQCLMAYTQIIDKTKIFDITADSFKSITFDVTQWSYRLGSGYYPKEPYTSSGLPADAGESFINQLQVFNKLKHTEAESSVSLFDFQTKANLLAASFERDAELELSALPVNNSRTVELDVQFYDVTAGSSTRQLLTFVSYVGVARCFIDNVASSI